uniref:Peptidase S1 domain-containing protein n=1 Tax=Panagrolaimus sp. ES5 TaxID=591445 RepID=A0AC34F0J6_9BILA
MFVKVGSYDTLGGIQYEIAKVIHPVGYLHGCRGCDLELIVLKENITFTDQEHRAQIIDLSKEKPNVGQICYVAGFGSIDAAGTVSPVLLMVTMTSISDDDCGAKQPDQTCFRSPTQSLAGGDSGSGYLCNNKLVVRF